MQNYSWIVFFTLLLIYVHQSACQYKGREAVGCFNDVDNEWAFFWWPPADGYKLHSATSCSQICLQQKFRYAGLGGGRGLDCHCGNGGYDRYGATGGCIGCNQRGESFACGSRDGLYRLLYVYKIDPPVDTDTRYIGCWTGPNLQAVLGPGPLRGDFPKDNMTVDNCINFCRTNNRYYAGIRNGTDCWCGGDLQWGGGLSPAYLGNCNVRCSGNDTEICGGLAGISLYRSECIDGFHGRPCQPCNCQNDTVCNKVTGLCPGSCKPGFTHTGGACQECPDGYYGLNCDSSCNCQTTCDKVTGACQGSCEEGWTQQYDGGPCSQECEDGYYGMGCKESCNCNITCIKTTGQCSSNCTTGWKRPKEGQPCSLEISPPSTSSAPSTSTNAPGPTDNSSGSAGPGTAADNNNTKWIGIGAGAGAAALLLIVILVIVFMRRRRQKENQDTDLIQEDSISHRASVLAVDNFEATIDTDPEGNNTTYPVPKLMEVMQRRNEEEKPFFDEFQNIPKGNMKDWDFAESHPLREIKNRFGNVFPYNENRVMLQSANQNDYINASYIQNYAGQIGYIAAQGPIASTVDDFLQMIWQEKVTKIVMVTNLVEDGKEKCEQYWPNEDGSTNPKREIVLKRTDELVFPDFIVKTFTMTKGGESRQLKHYLFSGWSDHEGLTYASSILSLLEMVKNDEMEGTTKANGHIGDKRASEYAEEDKNEEDPYDNSQMANYQNSSTASGVAPLLVHCSAGVGRTGTFIAIDYLLDQAKSEGQIDVFECVYKLREQRINMVQSLDQYRFVYIALLKALAIGSTSIACYNFEDALKELQQPNPETHKSKLYVQYEALDVLKAKHKQTEVTDALKPENKARNRSPDFIPLNRYRPTFVTEYKGTTGYINAVAVKGYKTKFAFLATQLPLEGTRADFWCMVYDYKSPVIVSLQSSDEDIYWPQMENESIAYGEFTVQCLTVQRIERHKINKLTLAVRHKERDPTTTVLLHVDWPLEVSLLDPETFFAVNDLITAHQHGKSTLPVIIQCMYGHARSGLVCGLNCLIDMINAEQQADVFQCVQHIRSTKPDFIHSFEQYKFLYSTTVKYISTMESYANFKKL